MPPGRVRPDVQAYKNGDAEMHHHLLCMLCLCGFLQAILALFRRHPWVRHADASHGAVGDVVEASVSIAWQARRGMSFAHLVYFNV